MAAVVMVRRVFASVLGLLATVIAPGVMAATIEGGVTNASTGSAIPSAAVLALSTAPGSTPIQAFSAGDGSYSIGVGAGSYFVFAGKSGFDSELYQELPCCDSGNGATIITLGESQTVSGVHFTLSPQAAPATVSGVVRRAADSTLLGGVQISALEGSGASVAATSTDANGAYTLSVPAGDYTIAASGAPAPLLDERYPNVQCRIDPNLFVFVCAGAADVFSLAAGQQHTGVDFALAPIASLTVGLTSAATGAPMNGTAVYSRDGEGASTPTPAAIVAGAATIELLSGGVVHVAASSNQCAATADAVCLAELAPGLPCAHFSCDFDVGTAFTLAKGEQANGPDFVLAAAAGISGAVTAAGVPVPGATVSVYTHEEERHVGRGAAIASTPTDALGLYQLSGLAADEHFVIVESAGHVGALYDDVPCPFNSCEVDGGTGIATTLGDSSTNIDFELELEGAFSGQVVEDGVGFGVGQVVVHAHTATGAEIRSVETASDGQYLLSGIPAGNYFVRFTHPQFRGELHANHACPDGNCDVTAGDAVVVVAGATTADVNAELERSNGDPPPRTLLFLNNCQATPPGCTLTGGTSNDSRSNRSSIIGGGTRVLSAFTGTPQVWSELVQCVRDVLQPYYVEVTDLDPCPNSQSGCAIPHHEAMIAGLPSNLGFSNGVAGVSPFTCGVIPNSITFTFANLDPDDLLELCWTATQELAHSFGLSHEMYCPDSMTYISGCGFKRYTDVLADVGTQGPCQPAQECQCGPTQQNAHQAMTGAVGQNKFVFVDGFEDDIVQRMRVRRDELLQKRGDQAPAGTCGTMDVAVGRRGFVLPNTD